MRLAAAVWAGLFLGLILVELVDYAFDVERRISDLERAALAHFPQAQDGDGE